MGLLRLRLANVWLCMCETYSSNKDGTFWCVTRVFLFMRDLVQSESCVEMSAPVSLWFWGHLRGVVLVCVCVCVCLCVCVFVCERECGCGVCLSERNHFQGCELASCTFSSNWAAGSLLIKSHVRAAFHRWEQPVCGILNTSVSKSAWYLLGNHMCLLFWSTCVRNRCVMV